MKLTPLDIRRQTFKKKGMGGYDPAEIHAFLETVAGEFEELSRENTSLAERMSGLEGKVDDYRRMEKTLQDTLLSAQKTSEELRKNAEQRGDLLVKEAQLKADQIISEARARLMDLQRQIADLKNLRSSYLAKFRSLLESHMEILQYQEMDSGVRIQTNIFGTARKEEPARPEPRPAAPEPRPAPALGGLIEELIKQEAQAAPDAAAATDAAPPAEPQP